jgi:hypothetical protein
VPAGAATQAGANSRASTTPTGAVPPAAAPTQPTKLPSAEEFAAALQAAERQGTMGAPAASTAPSGGIGLASTRAAGPPSTSLIRQGAVDVVGKLPLAVVQRIVRGNYGHYRHCYENGLRANAALAGTVTVKFVIAKNGEISQRSIASTDLDDTAVVACIIQGFSSLQFPNPESGVVTVVYPLQFAPRAPDAPTTTPQAKP